MCPGLFSNARSAALIGPESQWAAVVLELTIKNGTQWEHMEEKVMTALCCM